VPKGIDADKTSAQYVGGVLHIKLPKQATGYLEAQLNPAEEQVRGQTAVDPTGADVLSIEEQKRAAEEVSTNMNSDANYEAYLRDAHELQEKFSGYIVAYADGKRIGEGRDARELAARLPETYRKKGLFITDVSSEPVRFRRPFRILEK
jgi:hypothetical protein